MGLSRIQIKNIIYYAITHENRYNKYSVRKLQIQSETLRRVYDKSMSNIISDLVEILLRQGINDILDRSDYTEFTTVIYHAAKKIDLLANKYDLELESGVSPNPTPIFDIPV